MSQKATPEQVVHEPAAAPDQQGPPKGLLQQMEELMAALNADLSQLDADLQQSTGPGARPRTSTATSEHEHHHL